MGGVIRALQRFGAGDLQQLRRFPAIATEQRHLDAELPCLPDDQARVGVVAGHDDGIGLLALDGGELRA